MNKKRSRTAAPKPRWIKVLGWMTAFCLLMVIAAAVGAWMVYDRYSQDLPRINTLTDYNPPAVTAVFSNHGRKIAEFFKERRIVAPLSDIPLTLVNAFIAAEDARFYQHEGVDLVSIARAFFKNIEAGSVIQGGSTITQQVTKSFLLTPEKTYRRKIKEAILAYRIDKTFSKEEILFLYLNQIYLGHGAYGVAAAAENYFGKSIRELTLAECAVLAGLPQAPSRYSPYKNPDLARKRQKYVLERMVENQFITQTEADAALTAELDVRPRQNLYLETVPCFAEHVRRYVVEKYGEEALYNGGLKIHTTVDIELQEAARHAVDTGLRELDKRHSGYRGPIRRLAGEAKIEAFLTELRDETDRHGEPESGDLVQGVAVKVEGEADRITVRLAQGTGHIPFDTMDWTTRKTGVEFRPTSVKDAVRPGDLIRVRLVEQDPETGAWDLRLEQTPEAQGALLCLEAGTGHVRAMIGGRDFRESQFNRAVQSRRQPGSAFKPVIYAAALDKGYTPATEIIDNAFIYQDKNLKWKPKNYDRRFHGPTLLRNALTHSRNLSTINILDDIGVGYAIDYARKLGITSDLSRNLSIALGSSGVSLLELTTAYSVFANHGNRVKPVFITRILDGRGREIEGLEIDSEQVIEPATAYLMTSLLESVVKEGTGRRMRALGRPAAGKTGTTNDLHDAWFMGYTPDYIAGAWVGYDQERPLGKKETGSRAAGPIWLDFMKTAHQGLPVKVFQVPRGVVFSRIDADTGLLPATDSEQTVFEVFKEGTVPTRYTQRTDAVTEQAQFFKKSM
jgi:penicillin-binding protein 1A